MKTGSPFEGMMDRLNGRIALGQITDVDADNRTVRVRTIGSEQYGTDDQDHQFVKVLHFRWNPNGSYAIAIPEVGDYAIIGYLNSEPVLLGAYPLSQTTDDGEVEGTDNTSQPSNQIDDQLAEGDFAFVTAAGSKVIIRAGGTVEIEATKNTRTWWLPTNETITTVCQNHEMDAAPGFEHWSVDPDSLDTTRESRVYDNLEVGTVIRTQAGTTDTGAVFSMQIGPPADDLTIDEPVVDLEVQADGTTELTVGGADSNVTITITPDGKISINTTSDAELTVGGDLTATVTGDGNIHTDGDTTIDAGGDCNIKAGGDATVDAGGDCNIKAGGNVVVKGSQIQLNGSSSGITTMNSHMGVIDLITGAPVQPSTTTMGDI